MIRFGKKHTGLLYTGAAALGIGVAISIPQRAAAQTAVAAPATVTVGESSTEVLQSLGMPQQMIDLGKKKTYVYKTMKITFINDKVSDVQ